jgi:four helix bundle protein
MDLVVRVYEITRGFPKEELYGLTSQLRRAAVSVPSNIAEGKGRSSDKELVQFLNHSRGSLFEIETQIAIARRLSYIQAEPCDAILLQASRVGQLLNGLIRALRASTAA